MNLVVKFIVQESSDSIFETQFDYLYNSINTYTSIKYRNLLNDKVFEFIFTILTIDSSKLEENRLVILK